MKKTKLSVAFALSVCVFPSPMIIADEGADRAFWFRIQVTHDGSAGFVSPDQYDYSQVGFRPQLRLTNLRSTSNSRDIPDLPYWNGRFMGGLFKTASELRIVDYKDDWGHRGISSDQAFLPATSDVMESGDPWEYLYGTTESYDFAFIKYVEGRDVEIVEPLLVDFAAIGSDFTVGYSPHRSELRLFVPLRRTAGEGTETTPSLSTVGT